MRLLIFGPGYSATALIRRILGRVDGISATARSAETARRLRQSGVQPIMISGETSAELREAVRSASHVLVSAAPSETGDPFLNLVGETIAAATDLEGIVYLSTVGVYGDHAGDWVDETTPPRPLSNRSVLRLTAEKSWQSLAADRNLALAILRLSGIYGPGRNALVNLRAGTARCIVKPGQVFNRIHVADIAAAIDAALASLASGVFNVSDDSPARPQDVVQYAARLLGIPAPPEIAFERSDLSLMARSFYSENKRIANDRLKQKLGLALAYPSYREGLEALFSAGEGSRS
jgi:nucleoside-diphosphate-sugar epimerase